MSLDEQLNQQLLAFDQGRLSRSALNGWCRTQSKAKSGSQGARGLMAFLGQPGPETAQALLKQATALKAWISLVPLPQRMLLQRVCGGLVLEGAVLLQHNGQSASAEAMTLLVLDLSPDRVQAWLMLAQLQVIQKRGMNALETLAQGLGLFPNDLALHSLQAQLMLQAGLGRKALESYEQVVKRLPSQPESWLGLGNLRQALGDLDGAVSAYQQALQLAPTHAGLWNNLGRIHHRRLDYDQALAAYQRALNLQPGLVEAWNNLAALELDRRNLTPAAAALTRALALMPGYAPAWVNLGICEGLANHHERAIQAFARARALNPAAPEPWLEQASLELRASRVEAAAELLAAAVQAQPQAAEIRWLHSRLLAYRHRLADARAEALQAIQLEPGRSFWRFQAELDWSPAQFLLGSAARESWLNQLGKILKRWQPGSFGLGALLPELRFVPELLWGLLYLGDEPHCELRSEFAARFALPSPSLPTRRRGPDEPVRLGIVVTSGHEGIFLGSGLGLPLFERLPEDYRILVFGDPTALRDKLPARFSLIPLPATLPAAWDCLRHAELDLLYYWEIGSDTLNYFLPFQRLAPVQFTSWGTPLSSGLPGIDYYVSSALCEPDGAQAHYRERLLLSAGLPQFCPDPLPAAGDEGREALGLPGDGRLYVCFQNPLKYCPELLQALAGILARDKQARLVLLGSQQRWVQQRIEAALAASLNGIAHERVHWIHPPMSRARYLNYLRIADVALDTFGYNGIQTSDEALGLGVPVVTLPGRSSRARQTLARLKLLEIELCAVSSWDAYITRAIELAEPGPLRDQVRSTIQAHRMRLIENEAGPVEFARLLRQLAQPSRPNE